MREEDEDIDRVEPAKRLDRGRAGVAEVAPTMVTRSPRRASAASNSWPISCMAKSLNASVGPWNSSSRKWFGQLLQRRARGMAEARIGARDEVGELGIGEGVADEGPHHAERDLLVGQARQRGDVALRSGAGSRRARRARRRAQGPVSIASSNVRTGAWPRVET
jgi:hypothetical protein